MADFRNWPEADKAAAPTDVRFRGQSGQALDTKTNYGGVRNKYDGTVYDALSNLAVIGVGVLCLIIWLALIIRVDLENKTVTRYLFPLFVKTYSLSGIISVADKNDIDFYGKHPYTEIRFRNGDKWSLPMFSSNSPMEIKQMLRP